MFDQEFTESLLEKIGGNSATLVLDHLGVCVFASSAVQKVLQLEQKDIVGKSFLEDLKFFSLEGKPMEEIKNPVDRVLKQKDFIQTTPFFFKLSSDVAADTLVIKTFQIKDQEKIKAVIVQIRVAKREVDVGEMKSLFVSFAAHQLKTPSSVVKGFLELMMRQGEAAYSKEQWHFLTSAFESNENLIAVSKTLLNMARLEGGLIEPNIREFDPNRALQSKVASFAPLYKTKRLNINLSVSQDAEAVALHNDEAFFLEVFGILLGNAIKHSPIGGSITVSCILNNQNCEVHVIDEGPGIPPGVREKLFKSGQKPSDEDNSHGLGLYMAKKYIALLGGSLGLEEANPTGTGSDFYFTVPNSI